MSRLSGFFTSFAFALMHSGCLVGPGALHPPDAPADVSATAGDSEVLVSWTAPFSGGHSIRGYTVTAVEDSTKGCTSLSFTRCIVTGLTGGQPYTFRVTARNRIGTSPASVPSAPATPTALPAFASNWTARTVANTNDLYAAVWTGSLVVATGDFGSLVTSPDGITWTNHGSALSGSPYMRDIAYNGSLIVAVGTSGQVFTSTNGTTWTSRSTGTFNALQTVVWGRHPDSGGTGLWLTAGYDRTVLTSPDGITWTARDIGSPPISGTLGSYWGYSVRLAIRTDSLFVLFPEYDQPVLTSPDGVTWKYGPRFESLQFDAVLWTGSEIIAIAHDMYGGGEKEYVLRSTDGINWTRQRLEAPLWAASLAWTGTQFVTVGYDGVVTSSPDGEMWILRRGRQNLISALLSDVVWTGTRLVAVGRDGGILTSP